MEWTSIIAELQRLGLTQPQIAAYCECGQSTISDLGSGKTGDPRYSLGLALQQLLTERRALMGPQSAAPHDRRDPTRPSTYAGSDIDRRVPAQDA